jgi:hypothetical protein
VRALVVGGGGGIVVVVMVIEVVVVEWVVVPKETRLAINYNKQTNTQQNTTKQPNNQTTKQTNQTTKPTKQPNNQTTKQNNQNKSNNQTKQPNNQTNKTTKQHLHLPPHRSVGRITDRHRRLVHLLPITPTTHATPSTTFSTTLGQQLHNPSPPTTTTARKAFSNLAHRHCLRDSSRQFLHRQRQTFVFVHQCLFLLRRTAIPVHCLKRKEKKEKKKRNTEY